MIPYAFALHRFWRQGYRSHLLVAAIPLWILLGFYVCYVLDELAVPVFLFIAITIIMGYKEGLSTEDSKDDVKEQPAFRENKYQTKSHSGASESSTVSYSATPHRQVEEVDVIAEKMTATIINGDGEHLESDDLNESHSVGMFSMLGDMRDLSRSVIRHTYENVAEVLKEGSHETEDAKANAEVLRLKLKELGMSEDTSTGTRYLKYVFWAFFLLQALTTYYVSFPKNLYKYKTIGSSCIPKISRAYQCSGKMLGKSLHLP